MTGRRSWSTRCGSCPGFVDVNSDMQIASPQVMVDIDRDRALALGRHAAADPERALHRHSAAARSPRSTLRPTNTR